MNHDNFSQVFTFAIFFGVCVLKLQTPKSSIDSIFQGDLISLETSNTGSKEEDIWSSRQLKYSNIEVSIDDRIHGFRNGLMKDSVGS